MKKILLTLAVASIAIASQAQKVAYSNDFTTDPNPLISSLSSGAFTHASDGNNWTITADGTGEWDIFELVLPTVLDLSGPNPTVKLSGVTTTDSALFSVMLIDDKGHSADAFTEKPDPGFMFEFSKNAPAQDFSYDFDGQFTDIHGSLVDGSGQGPTDASKIAKLRFRVNQGWASAGVHTSTITGKKYNQPLKGTISIGKLEIFGSAATGIATIAEFNNLALAPNPSEGLVNASFDNKNAETINVSVSNILGQDVYNTTTSASSIKLDLSGEEKGMYFVRFESKNGVSVKRVIVK